METTELQTAHGSTFSWWKNVFYFERALKKRLFCNFQYGRHDYSLTGIFKGIYVANNSGRLLIWFRTDPQTVSKCTLKVWL